MPFPPRRLTGEQHEQVRDLLQAMRHLADRVEEIIGVATEALRQVQARAR